MHLSTLTTGRTVRSRACVPAIVVAAAVGVLLALVSPATMARPAQPRSAAAAPNTNPVRFWSLGRFDHGDGSSG
jgi:hypothetical protein